MKYAWWDGVSWQMETVDATGDVGDWTSRALDTEDYPHISYLDRTRKGRRFISSLSEQSSRDITKSITLPNSNPTRLCNSLSIPSP